MRWTYAVTATAGLLVGAAVPHLVFGADTVPSTQAAAGTAGSVAYSDLRFADFFKRPIGPRGLEASALLTAMNGRPVRMVGYMAHQDGDTAVPGIFVLSPLPVTLGDEDESFADDLPASVLYVHIPPGAPANTGKVAYIPGLLSVRGMLEIGAQPEADGRISFVRLQLDGEPVRIEAPQAVRTPHALAGQSAQPTSSH